MSYGLFFASQLYILASFHTELVCASCRGICMLSHMSLFYEQYKTNQFGFGLRGKYSFHKLKPCSLRYTFSIIHGFFAIVSGGAKKEEEILYTHFNQSQVPSAHVINDVSAICQAIVAGQTTHVDTHTHTPRVVNKNHNAVLFSVYDVCQLHARRKKG